MKSVSRSYVPYPASLPCPLQSSYSVTQEHGTVSTAFGNGWIRQRRLSPWTYRYGTMSFRMSVQDFNTWHDWVHKTAFKWIEMYVQDSRGVYSSEPYTSPRIVRFTGSASYNYGDWDYVDVSIPFEFMEDEGEVPA